MAAAGVPADWPAPNFIDPPDRIAYIASIEIPLLFLMTLAVAARFYSRAILRRILSWDDWLMLPAWACLATVTITSLYSTMHLNLTRHLWDVKPEWAEQALKINVMFEILYPFGVALTKISICLNYLRIFPLQTFNECFCKVAMVFTACWCISTIIPQIDQYVECPPVSNTRERIRVNSDCINQQAFLISTAALNSFSDLCIFLWPARYIWGMHVPKEQRWGLIGLFCVGVIICIAGVLRMWFFTVWFRSHDPYWDGVWNYIILAVETNAGFICACLPCCKPLLVRLFPSVFSNSDSRRNAEEAAGGDGAAGGVAGHGPSPLDPEYQRVRKKRSTWSFWGTGTTTTTTTTGTGTTSTRSHHESKRRSRSAVPAGGGGTGLLGGVVGSSADGNKSDTAILMDDLSGNHGYCHTDGGEEQDSVIVHDRDPDPGLTVTPQLRPTDDTTTTGNVDLELGFVRSLDHPSAR
ncbi:putative integral membrane protein [Lasiodiplodia theobromae]|nr:putative integral membrane protein [Lasiodiplodia theobromae]